MSCGRRLARRHLDHRTYRTNIRCRTLAQLDESERDDAELRGRSLIYVAATRARDELTVMQRV